MTPLDIKIELLRAGVSQADIARECEVSRSQVSRVIGNQCVSDHVRRAVATAIGKGVEDVWPEYYLSASGPPDRPVPKTAPAYR